MKQISLADAARRTTSAKTKVVAEDTETDEEYFKRIDAKVMQKTNELLAGDCTREQLAKIAAEYMVCFVELIDSRSRSDKFREESMRRIEEQVQLHRQLGDLREYHGVIEGLRIGRVVGKKEYARAGAKATNKIKTDGVRKRIEWYKNNYSSQVSTDPKRKGKIATKKEMEVTMADKYNIGLDAAKKTVDAARKELREKGVLR